MLAHKKSLIFTESPDLGRNLLKFAIKKTICLIFNKMCVPPAWESAPAEMEATLGDSQEISPKMDF